MYGKHMQNFIHLRLACARILVCIKDSRGIRDNGIKRLTVGLPTVCGVWELAEVWTKQSNSGSMHMRILAQGEESGGSRFPTVVPVVEDIHMQALL